MSRDDYLERAVERGKKGSATGERRVQKKMFWIWRRVQWRIENLSWNKKHFLSLSFSPSTAVVHVAILYERDKVLCACPVCISTAEPIRFPCVRSRALYAWCVLFPDTISIQCLSYIISFLLLFFHLNFTFSFLICSTDATSPQIYVTPLTLVPFLGIYKVGCQ